MIFGPVKFLMKLIILFMLLVVFVVFHNTEFGENLERQIGQALEYENLREKALDIYRKAAGSSALEEIDTKKIGKDLKKQVVNRLKGSDAVKKLPAKAEKIIEEERKKLEDIIEGGG